MVIYKIFSLFIYIVFIPVFLVSSIIMIAATIFYLPLFFKIDKFFCRLIMSSLFVWPKIKGKFPENGGKLTFGHLFQAIS